MGLVVLVNVFDRPPQMRGSAIDGDEFQVPYQSRNEDSHKKILDCFSEAVPVLYCGLLLSLWQNEENALAI